MVYEKAKIRPIHTNVFCTIYFIVIFHRILTKIIQLVLKYFISLNYTVYNNFK